MATFAERMIGAARLDAATYEEVEHDATALGQAMAVVVLSAVAAGIGGLRGGAGAIVTGTLAGLLGWVMWAFIIYLVGAKLLPEPSTRSDMGELLRCIGFASTPGILRVAGVVPVLGGLVTLVASLWTLVAMVVAVRQALDYTSTARAVVVCVLGFAAYVAVFFAIVMVAGMGGLVMGGPGR